MAAEKEEMKHVKVDNAPQFKLTNYDIHKQMYAQTPKATDVVIKGALRQVSRQINADESQYYMLMCREKYDITPFILFEKDGKQTADEVVKTLESRGTLWDIQKDNENGTFQFWVKDSEGDMWMYMFFDCADWVVEIVPESEMS